MSGTSLIRLVAFGSMFAIAVTGCGRGLKDDLRMDIAPVATRTPSPVGEVIVEPFTFGEGVDGIVAATRIATELFVDNTAELRPEAADAVASLSETLDLGAVAIRVDSVADGIDDPPRAFNLAESRAKSLAEGILRLHDGALVAPCAYPHLDQGPDVFDPMAARVSIVVLDRSTPVVCSR